MIFGRFFLCVCEGAFRLSVCVCVCLCVYLRTHAAARGSLVAGLLVGLVARLTSLVVDLNSCLFFQVVSIRVNNCVGFLSFQVFLRPRHFLGGSRKGGGSYYFAPGYEKSQIYIKKINKKPAESDEVKKKRSINEVRGVHV